MNILVNRFYFTQYMKNFYPIQYKNVSCTLYSSDLLPSHAFMNILVKQFLLYPVYQELLTYILYLVLKKIIVSYSIKAVNSIHIRFIVCFSTCDLPSFRFVKCFLLLSVCIENMLKVASV